MGDLINIRDSAGGLEDLDDDLEGDDEAIEAIGDDEAISNHPLVQAFRDESVDTVERLQLIKEGIARCAAELGFQTLHPEYFEQPEAGRAVSRRVRMLRRIAEVELMDRRAQGWRPSHADHPDVPKLLDLLLERIVGVAHDVLPTELAMRVETRFREELAADPQIPWPPPGATP